MLHFLNSVKLKFYCAADVNGEIFWTLLDTAGDTTTGRGCTASVTVSRGRKASADRDEYYTELSSQG